MYLSIDQSIYLYLTIYLYIYLSIYVCICLVIILFIQYFLVDHRVFTFYLCASWLQVKHTHTHTHTQMHRHTHTHTHTASASVYMQRKYRKCNWPQTDEVELTGWKHAIRMLCDAWTCIYRCPYIFFSACFRKQLQWDCQGDRSFLFFFKCIESDLFITSLTLM